MNEDFSELLAAMVAEGARFLIVGAHAVAVHGVPRATGDLDVWIDRNPDNASRVWRALVAFGAPLEALDISIDHLQQRELVIQLGLPPRRIDILTDVTGLFFAEAWEDRKIVLLGPLEVPFLGRESLLRNKRSTGRLRDRADLEALGAEAADPPHTDSSEAS